MGVADSGPVDDDDVGRAGVVSDALAEAGQKVSGIAGFNRLGDPGGVAEGDGDTPGLFDGLLVVGLARERGVERKSDEHRGGDDPERGEQDPRGQGHVHLRPTAPDSVSRHVVGDPTASAGMAEQNARNHE
jgi:hypothetical protein